MPNRAAAPRRDRFAVVAAALAWVPIGFVLGGYAAARALGPGASEGGLIAASGLLGAVAAAALVAGVATRLPAKPLRVATVVAGGVSFALIIYLVRDFVADRMRQADAVDAAYARMAPFALRIESNDANRRLFSALTFDSATGAYTARRPGGWLCQGDGRREHAVALARGLQLAVREDAVARPPEAHCPTRVAWRYHAAAAAAAKPLEFDRDACAPPTLLLAADALVARTARRASCRQPSGPRQAAFDDI